MANAWRERRAPPATAESQRKGGEVGINRLESGVEVDRSASGCGGLWDSVWAGMNHPATLESFPLHCLGEADLHTRGKAVGEGAQKGARLSSRGLECLQPVCSRWFRATVF